MQFYCIPVNNCCAYFQDIMEVWMGINYDKQKFKESPSGFDLSPILIHCETLLKETNQTIIPNLIENYKANPVNLKFNKIGKI